jgi:hypothetical protein
MDEIEIESGAPESRDRSTFDDRYEVGTEETGALRHFSTKQDAVEYAEQYARKYKVDVDLYDRCRDQLREYNPATGDWTDFI